jgi:hypothetical protein
VHCFDVSAMPAGCDYLLAGRCALLARLDAADYA